MDNFVTKYRQSLTLNAISSILLNVTKALLICDIRTQAHKNPNMGSFHTQCKSIFVTSDLLISKNISFPNGENVL